MTAFPLSAEFSNVSLSLDGRLDGPQHDIWLQLLRTAQKMGGSRIQAPASELLLDQTAGFDTMLGFVKKNVTVTMEHGNNRASIQGPLLNSAWALGDTICYELPEYIALNNPLFISRFNLLLRTNGKQGYESDLFVLCTRFSHTTEGAYQTPFLLIDTLRKELDSGEVYPQFRDFNRWVLKRAMREINKSTLYRITVEYQRQAQRITAARFTLQRRNG